MDKLLCRPLMLSVPTNGSVFKSWNREGVTTEQRNDDIEAFYHIYLVSDRVIYGGDWYWNPVTNSISPASGQGFDKMFKKVEASTNPKTPLPFIPQQWIQDVFVPANGKIETVYLKCNEEGTILLKPTTLLSPMSGYEVIILPIKDSWNKDEIKALHKEWEEDSSKPRPLDKSMYFDEWLDKKY